MNRFLIFFFAFLAFNSIQSQEIKNINWEKDIKSLQKKLPEKHKYLFYVRTRAEFNKDIESLLASHKSLSDLGIALKMQQVIARLGDSHTNIGWQDYIDYKRKLPLELYWFKDGIYVIKTVSDNQDLLGKRITKINQTPINEVIDSLSTLIVKDNSSIIKSKIPDLLTKIQLLEYFNFITNDNVTIETEDQSGKTLSYKIQPSEMNNSNIIKIEADTIPFTAKQDQYFIDKYFETKGIYYIQYNICFSRELPPPNINKVDINQLPSFSEFAERVNKIINEKPIKKLIIDLRYNGGGNSYQGTKFVEFLSKIEKINQKGILYVIIGRRTFSSAIINTMDFKRYTKATTIGEETGGKPNHFGEVRTFKLPNSKIKVYYSTKFIRRADKDVNTINPDIKIEASFNDYQAGIDPVYEWIKSN